MWRRKPKSARGKQNRARVAGRQNYEADYEAKKTGKSASAVKRAVKKVGNTRKRVEKISQAKRGRNSRRLLELCEYP